MKKIKTVYVDNNSTTKVSEDVVKELLPYYMDYYGNPSSAHSFGSQVHIKMQEARERVAQLINADPEEIYFTSGGTESDNLAIQGSLYIQKDKDEIIVSAVEHPAVLKKCEEFQQKGYSLIVIPVDRCGNLDLETFIKSVSSSTALISIMHANNETGVIFPVDEISLIARDKKIPFHIDGVQAVGKIKIDVKKIGCDFYSISAHKFHGPKGIGALYIRKGINIKSLLMGGHQEKEIRPGTENVTGIIGIGKAAELTTHGTNNILELRDYFEERLLELIPDILINGKSSMRVSNTSNISFKNYDTYSILHFLEKNGIFASNGAACNSGSIDPSHVIRAMKVPAEYAYGTVRFSFSKNNNIEEIDYIIETFKKLNNLL